MLSRIQLSAIVIVVAAAWAVLLVIDGFAVSLSWFRPLSTVLAVLVILVAILDKWAWHWRVLQPWLIHVPDLRGTWRAELRRTNGAEDTINAYMAIRQTCSSLSMRLMSNESASMLLAARMTKAADGEFTVTGVYQNVPNLSVRDQSPIHNGAILLNVQGTPPVTLDGQYWTDRATRGELRLTRLLDRVCSSYSEALQADETA